jgi:DNA-binding LytR/AlgR family response regulator
LFEEIRNTCLVGVLFFSILVPVNYIRLKSQHTDIASQFNAKPHPEKVVNKVKTVAIQTQQKSDDFCLDPKGFLFAKAEGNYLEIFVSQNGQVQKLLKRMTLKEFEAQLNAHDHIIRTHRSYLVNLHQVSDIKGNAQGYQLHLNQHQELVPVSRGMIPLFESRINT